MAFDVLWTSKGDSRPKITYRRLEYLKQIVALVSKYCTNGTTSRGAVGVRSGQSPRLPDLQILQKHFLHWPRGQAHSGDLVRQMLERDYPVDGLIFTPDTPYPTVRKWPQLLKWKGSQATVDLFVKKNAKAQRWDLYVSANFATVNRDQSRCLIFKRVPDEDLAVVSHEAARFARTSCQYWVVTGAGLVVQHPSRELTRDAMRCSVLFPFVPFLPISVELEDSMVYEFYWNQNENRLVPLCKRVDKSLQSIKGANDLTVAVDVWESMKYPVKQAQLMALPNVGDRAGDKSFGSYPYVKDLHPSLDWKAIFEGRPADNVHSSWEREQQALRRMHNRIKEHVIHAVTHNSRIVSDAQRLQNIGGQVISGRSDSLQNTVRSACWSLPNSASVRKILETEWGIQTEVDCTNFGERLHVYEHVLRKQQAQLSLTENAKIVVDFACGRGGDQKKMIKNSVQVLVGIDNVPELLYANKDSALKRWTEEQMTSKRLEMDTCFVLADLRQPIYDTLVMRGIPLEADVVTCFFAVHYFFSTERDARSFFQNVKDVLKPNGYFVGTIIDGELMFEKLRQTGNYYHRADPENPVPLFSVEAKNFDATKIPFEKLPDFGSVIDVSIISSMITMYATLPEKSGFMKQENLVKFDTFVALAADYDLEIVGSQTFDQYFPAIPYITLSEPVAKFSALHRTFCFRKTSKSKDDGTHTFTDIRDSVRILQQQQLHSGIVEDDCVTGIYASESAYPDDALIRTIEPMDISDENGDDGEDGDDGDEEEENGDDEEENGDDEEENGDDEEAELGNGDEEGDVEEKEENKEENKDDETKKQENKEDDEMKAQETKEQETKEQETKEQVEPPKIVLTTKAKKQKIRPTGCTTRCQERDCSGCLCKRTLRQKCTDACGCGDFCSNR